MTRTIAQLTFASVFPLAIIVTASCPADAAVIYEYVGEPFTTVDGPFTTSDSVSGFVKFSASPPTPGMLDESSIADYAFTAGPLTLTPDTPGAGAFANFTFDAAGDITNWLITVSGFTPGSNNTLEESINTDWNGIDGDDFAAIDDLVAGHASNALTPGVWRRIPEPTSLALVGMAGAAIAMLPTGRHRRSRLRA